VDYKLEGVVPVSATVDGVTPLSLHPNDLAQMAS
jgi:hypothetical protein